MSELSKELRRYRTNHESQRVRDGWDGDWVTVATTQLEHAADEIEALESKLDAIRLKCLDELKHDRRTTPFEEGRMDFADVLWRMVVQPLPVLETLTDERKPRN